MDEAILKSLKVLKYEQIRPNQERVVKEYLKGNDVLFCSPTGSGKSLTFEIAPFAFDFFHNDSTQSTIIVVSPLVALMESQSENLQKRGVKAVYLQDIYEGNSEVKYNITELHEGKADIIFASPESLLGEHRSLLINLSKNRALKAIFVDEAHCIKKYGKTDKKRKKPAFRPQYGQLGEVRSLVQKNVPIVALTATATKQTRELIMKDLCMTKCTQLVVNPEKKNVKYSVEITRKDLTANFKWLYDLIADLGQTCPRIIVFFRQIKQIAEVFEYLQISLGDRQYVPSSEDPRNGYWNRIFAMFHLTTNEDIKKCICTSFQKEDGKIRVVLCSTSFSMDLDIKGVHTVVHYGPANDLDDYLQETGRAGRDATASCNAILVKYTRCLSSQNITTEMRQYVSATTCRRLLLLKPFWEEIEPLLPKHDCCDICSSMCRCQCLCSGTCNCIEVCSFNDSHILTNIRNTISIQENDSSSESPDESFSSDTDFENYLAAKPNILMSSDSDI